MYPRFRSSVVGGRHRCFPSEKVRISCERSLIVSLISIFAVHCTTLPLRILNVRLDSDKPFDVWTGSPSERDLVCVPNSPAKFVYQITKVGSPEEVAASVGQGHPLTFVISYRFIEKGMSINIVQANVRN